MSRLSLLALLALGSAASAQSVQFKTYPEARDAARKSGTDFVVFFAGPSWLSETAAVRAALTTTQPPTGLAQAAGWALVPAEDLAADSKVKGADKSDWTPYDLPSLALVDPTGRTFAAAEGLSPANLAQALQALAAAQPSRVRREALFEKARAAQGVERARFFGQGLDQVAFRFSSLQKEILKEIADADPADATGYTFKYTFQAGGFHERLTEKLIHEKKQQELLAQVDQHLKNPVLLPTQRQALLSAKMQAYRSLDDIPKAVAVLRQIIQIDPRSELGAGAVQYIRLLTEPVRLPGLTWETYDNRPTWLPMVADVSARMKEPGAYRIEFKHLDGQTRFRKVSLFSGGHEIASDANAKESTTVRLTVPASAQGRKIELQAESQGTGWFAGRGEIVITKE